MSFFHQLTEKPWLPVQGGGDVDYVRSTYSLSKEKLGLRVFLGVVTVLFLLLIIAYGGRMAFEDWRPVPDRSLLWQNTIMLILASVALQWTLHATNRGRMDHVKIGLFAGGAFTLAFLAGQIVAWQELGAMDYFEITNPSIAFFYMITGLHALHIAGGLVAWVRTFARVWGDDYIELGQIRLSIELCATYWHFLLAVWLVLFGLLFSGNNLGILLAICGIG